MAPPCTVCSLPAEERQAVDHAIVAGSPAPRIAANHRVSDDAIRRHARSHVGPLLTRAQEVEGQRQGALADQAAAVQASETEHALDVMAELRRCFQRVNLLFDACDRWLRDPDNPDQYDVGARADDVQVTYLVPGPNGSPVRKKAPLSRLLARLDDAKVDVDRGEVKFADPRELILKAAGQLSDQVTLLAKLLGDLDDRPQVNVALSPEWVAIRSHLLEALAPWPEARVAVAGRLMTLEGVNANGHRG